MYEDEEQTLIENAREELKRTDHLIFVSLKYTRTVDVLKNIVERMINAIEFGVEALLEHCIDKRKIPDMPPSHKEKISTVLEIFKEDENVIKFMELYQMLRKIRRAKYQKREEFRRHVTMIATLDDGKVIDVDMDKVKEFNDQTIEFIDYIEDTTLGKKEE